MKSIENILYVIANHVLIYGEIGPDFDIPPLPFDK